MDEIPPKPKSGEVSDNPYVSPTTIPANLPGNGKRAWYLPFVGIAILAIPSLVPPFTFIGLPCLTFGSFAFFRALVIVKRRSAIATSSTKNSIDLAEPRETGAAFAFLIFSSIAAGAAVFGGVCTPIALGPYLFDFYNSLYDEWLSYGIFFGIAAGIGGAVLTIWYLIICLRKR